MRIAFTEAFPNKPFTAEREFAARLAVACERLGHQLVQPVTSDDVLTAAPDVVLASHEFVPKLSPHVTLGVSWNPPADYEGDPERQRNLLSYDGYLSGGRSVSRHIADCWFSTGQSRPVHEFFYPSSPCFAEGPAPGLLAGNAIRLFYVGAHWDGRRFGQLFRLLEHRGVPLDVFGPRKAWRHLRRSYRGELDLDGVSVIRRIAESGAALALHRDSHRAAGIPSMRLFEAAAAGAMIIADDFSFPRHAFGDTVLYVDMERHIGDIADQIAAHMGWIAANPVKACEMAAASAAIFREKYSLESLLAPLPDFVAHCAAENGLAPRLRSTARDDEPVVEIIMRVGGRPIDMVERAVASLARETHPRLILTVVEFAPVEDLDELLLRHAPRFEKVKRLQADKGCRSQPMWVGFNAATGDFVGVLDDDDEIHTNHISSLVGLLTASLNWREDAPGWAFAGTVLRLEALNERARQTDFVGPAAGVVAETRKIRFLTPFSAAQMWSGANMICNGAWLADRRMFTPSILIDPEFDYLEDVYLYLLLSQQARPHFSWRATYQWNMRNGGDNATFDKEARRQWWPRLWRRTRHLRPEHLDSLLNDENRVLATLTGFAREMYAWRRPVDQLKALPANAILAIKSINRARRRMRP